MFGSSDGEGSGDPCDSLVPAPRATWAVVSARKASLEYGAALALGVFLTMSWLALA